MDSIVLCAQLSDKVMGSGPHLRTRHDWSQSGQSLQSIIAESLTSSEYPRPIALDTLRLEDEERQGTGLQYTSAGVEVRQERDELPEHVHKRERKLLSEMGKTVISKRLKK